MLKQVVAVALLWNIAGLAASGEVESSWANLSPLIVNKRIAIVLPGGGRVEGEAVEVRPEELAMKVGKTSDAHANPKGVASIPRASVKTLQLLEMRSTGRIVGTILGAGAGLGVAVAIILAGGIFSKDTGAKTAGIIAVTAGLPVAGFFIGRSADRKVTTIRITR
jgi:hypothetical protein